MVPKNLTEPKRDEWTNVAADLLEQDKLSSFSVIQRQNVKFKVITETKKEAFMSK